MIQHQEQIARFFRFDNKTKQDSLRPVPDISDAVQLRNPEIAAKFGDVVKEIVQTDNGELAILGRRLLQDLLLPQDPQMRQAATTVYLEYQKLIGMLKFVNLSTYSQAEIAGIVQSHIATVVALSLPVINRFQRVADAYDELSTPGKVPQMLANAMMASQERIGTRPLSAGPGKNVPPTVGNWLRDFLEFSVGSAEGNTGSLQRVKYFEANSNAKGISSSERELLLKIFRVYNWLLFGEEESQADAAGEIAFAAENLKTGSALPSLPRVQASPKPQLQFPPKAFRSSPPEGPTVLKKPQQPGQTPSFRPGFLGSSGGVNVQDILYRQENEARLDNRGLKMESDTPQKAPAPPVSKGPAPAILSARELPPLVKPSTNSPQIPPAPKPFQTPPGSSVSKPETIDEKIARLKKRSQEKK